MNTTPIKPVLDFAPLAGQSASAQNTSQDLEFQMLLENALNPQIPTGSTSQKADTKDTKAAEKTDVPKEERKTRPDGTAAEQTVAAPVTPEAPTEETVSAATTTEAIVLPEVTVNVPEATIPLQQQEITTALPVIPEPDGVPAGPLPTGDIVSTQLVTPQQQTEELVIAPEQLEANRLVQVDLEKSQETFDQLMAKSTAALAAKTPAPQETPSVPSDTLEPVSREAAAPAAITEPATEALSTEVPKAAEPGKLAGISAEEEEDLDASLVANSSSLSETSKTAEAKPLERTEPQQQTPAQQVQTQVIEHLEQEKMEFRMQLSPQSLGKIDVKMVLEGGKLTVELIAASAKTADLLSRQTHDLAASLRVSGAQLQSVQVVTQAETENSHMEQSLNLSMGGSYQEDASGSQQAEAGVSSPRSGATGTEQPDATHAEPSTTAAPRQMLNTTV